jgi:hypothetical protein
MIEPYIVGILWAIGRYTKDDYDYFFLRYKDRYFLDVVREALNVPGEVFLGSSRTGPQYRLKIHHFDMTILERLGWQPRLSEQRGYPSIIEHRDFIRAYIEIHGSIDTSTIRKRNASPYRQPRLRVYGNKHFLNELSEILFTQANIGVKKVQKTSDVAASSGILYYQSRSELKVLLNYLYPPEISYFHREYYGNFREVLITKW